MTNIYKMDDIGKTDDKPNGGFIPIRKKRQDRKHIPMSGIDHKESKMKGMITIADMMRNVKL